MEGSPVTTTYEYHIVVAGNKTPAVELEKGLNEAGKKGFRLVFVDAPVAIMERQVESE
jgi:hypothetical protein